MNVRNVLMLSAIACAAVTLCASDGVWTAGTGAWTNAAAWNNGVLPDAGAAASFAASGGTVTVPSGYPFTLSALLFNTNGANVAWTLTGETNTLVAPAVIRVDTNTVTLSASLAGSGGLLKTGDGTLALMSSSPSLTGSVTVRGGRVLVNMDSALGQVPASYLANAIVLDGGGFGNNDSALVLAATRGVTVGTNGAYLFGRNNNAPIMASPITGPGSVYINAQTGPVILSNTNNAYAGDTVVGAYGPGYFDGAASATLQLGASEVLPQGAGTGGLIIDGNKKGVLDLNGKTETVNRLTGYGNAVLTNSAAGTGLLRAGIGNGDMNFSGSLQARTVLEKIGSGVLVFSNTSASAGSLLVSSGALEVSTAQSLGQATVTLNGGQLRTPAQGSAVQTFAAPLLLAQNGELVRTLATAPIVWGSDVAATAGATGTPLLTVTGSTEAFSIGATNRPALFNADVADSHGVLFRDRVWLACLPISSSWSIAPGAEITIGKPGLLGTNALTLTNYSERLVSSDALGAGGETVTVGGVSNTVWFDATRFANAAVTNDPSYAFTASNNVILSGTGARVGFDGAGTVTYAGSISGSGALVKNGSGDAVLAAANSFAGSVQLNAGRLLVSDDSQLGNGANAVTLSGGYLGNASGASVTVTRNIQATSGGFDVQNAELVLSGVVSGAASKRGSGTLTLSGSAANPVLDLSVAAGNAVLNKSGVSAVRDLTVGVGAKAKLSGTGGNQIAGSAILTGGTLDMNGISETVGRLDSASLSSAVTNGGAAAAVLTVGEGGAGGTFFGSLADGAPLGLTKTGTNVFTLAGAAGSQTATGGLRVEGGTLAIGTGVRYVRVSPGTARVAGTMPAMGEFQLLLKGQPVAWPSGTAITATSSSGANVPGSLIDSNARTYWQVGALPASGTIDMKRAVLCDGYRWYTCTDITDRDPLNWTVEVSADGTAWFTADARTNQTAITANRGALAGAYAFSGAWPCDAVSAAMGAFVASGSVLRVTLQDESMAGLTGSGEVALAAGASLRVADAGSFAGTVSGEGRLLLGGNAALSVPSAAAAVTAVNDGAAPAAVTVGSNGETLFAGALADGSTSSIGLTKRGSGTLALLDAGSAYTGDTRVEQGVLNVQAPVWSFRYVRFNPTLTKGNNTDANGYPYAIAEFQLMRNGSAIAYPVGTVGSATTNSHADGRPQKAVDGWTTNRWLSAAIPNPVVIDMKSSVSFDAYHWYNAATNVSDEFRSPVSWTVDGSNDGVTWVPLDSQTKVTLPSFTLGTAKEVGPFSLRPGRYKLTADLWAATNTAALKLSAVSAKYLRFTVTDTRWQSSDFGNTGFQLAELQLLLDGTPVSYPAGTTASAPGDGYNISGTYYRPSMAVDNIVPPGAGTTNRWYSDVMVNPLTVSMGQPMAFNGYRWYTGPNGQGRDPLSWTLEISNNSNTWYTVDTRTNQNVNTARGAVAGTWALDLPAGQLAADAIPDVSRTYVASGAALRIDAASETVGPLSGTGTVVLASSTAFGINGFENAAYAGGITGTGTVTKIGAATQTLSGALAFSGTIIVQAGTLDLTGATLTGVTNITIRSGGTLAGTATVNGNLTVTFEGGAYRANLTASGALTIVGSMKLALPDGVSMPYTQRLFAFGSADAATRAALQAAVGTLTVPHGFAASVLVSSNAAQLVVAAPGTVLLVR